MKKSKEILSSTLKAVQLGQAGIRSVLDLGMKSTLRAALETQLQAYSKLEADAHTLASQRGWELRELDPMQRFWIDAHARAKINGNNTDSRIAGMLIQRSTKGIIRGFQDLHQMKCQDQQVETISQRFLDQEATIIGQMKRFL